MKNIAYDEKGVTAKGFKSKFCHACSFKCIASGCECECHGKIYTRDDLEY